MENKYEKPKNLSEKNFKRLIGVKRKTFEATIERFCGDEGYLGTFVDYVGWDFDDAGVDISKRIKPTFEILPKRWIVERTFAWAGNSRRLSKDYEISTDSAENMLLISNLHTFLRRYWS